MFLSALIIFILPSVSSEEPLHGERGYGCQGAVLWGLVQTAPRVCFLLRFIFALPHIILYFNTHCIILWLKNRVVVCGGLCFYVIYLVLGQKRFVLQLCMKSAV